MVKYILLWLENNYVIGYEISYENMRMIYYCQCKEVASVESNPAIISYSEIKCWEYCLISVEQSESYLVRYYDTRLSPLQAYSLRLIVKDSSCITALIYFELGIDTWDVHLTPH